VNKIKVATPTKEQIEYEDAKKNFRIATAKARILSAGIDQSKISQQALDKVIRIFDDMEKVQQDTQQKTSKIQRDAEVAIQKINQDANQKYSDVQKRHQDLINSLKGDNKEDISQTEVQVQTQSENVTESSNEEVKEITREDKIAQITEILLHAMRGEISTKVNELMCTIDQKTKDVGIQSPDTKEEISQPQTDVQNNDVQKNI
jgi:hypothetical protein